MSETEKVVCVTGASGYIASWLVKLLLQHGYTVNATVRDTNDPKKTDHLLALDGASERLHLFKAELLDEGCFDSAVQGCIGVFHIASPCKFTAEDPHAELLEPAVKGTLNVLRSCAKVPSIKRVIITSSISAIVFTGKPLADDVVVDETWYSDPIVCQQFEFWYGLSKILAEKAAWEFSEENGIEIVTLNPDLVLGPLLKPSFNAGVQSIADLIAADIVPNLTFRWVDVRDVAIAHKLAFENPSACGRYIVAGKPTHSSELSKILRELYPDLKLPATCSYEKQILPVVLPFQVSQERVKSLGINCYTPLEVSLKDTIESLKEKELLKV